MDDGDELEGTRPQLSPPPRRPNAPVAGRDPLIGQELGEYTIVERVGGGAMGTVYRGVQRMLGRPVAIKLMLNEFANEPVYVERFLAEARAAASVHHPNIIDIYSLGLTPAGHPYLVMELLEGETLEDYLRYEGGQLEARDAVELLLQTTAALAAAHRAGIIHRDLKPSNIFVVRIDEENRFIKLLDFGVAKRTAPGQGARATAAMVGTPMYMAPEAFDGGVVGAYTDFYSLGCVAYELVAGEPPFNRNNVLALAEAHRNTTPAPPVGPGVPKALTQLILDLLQKDPARRPQANAVIRKLQQLANELDDSAPKTSPALHERTTRSTRIRPVPTVIVAPLFAPTGEVARPTAVEAPPTVLKPPVVERPRRARWGLAAVGALAVGAAAAIALWPHRRPEVPAAVVEQHSDPPKADEPKPEPAATQAPKTKVASKVNRPAPTKDDPTVRRERRIQALIRRAEQLDSAKGRSLVVQLDSLLRELDAADVEQNIDHYERQLSEAEKEPK